MNQAWRRVLTRPVAAIAGARRAVHVQQLSTGRLLRCVDGRSAEAVAVAVPRRMLSSGKSGKDSNDNKGPRMTAPDEFYDPEVERAEELADFMNAQLQGGFHYLTAPRDEFAEEGEAAEGDAEFKNLNLDNLEELAAKAAKADVKNFYAEMEAVVSGTGGATKNMPPPSTFLEEMLDTALNPLIENKAAAGRDRMSLDADALAAMAQESQDEEGEGEGEEYEEPIIVPKGQAKTRIPFEQSPDSLDPTFKAMLRKYDPLRYGNEPGTMPCKGGRQRKGNKPLSCHVIDLEQLHYTNTLELARFLDEDGMIQGRDDTRLCARCQRKVAKTIKQARQLGFVPHIGQFSMTDKKALAPHEPLHDQAEGASESVLSKTI